MTTTEEVLYQRRSSRCVIKDHVFSLSTVDMVKLVYGTDQDGDEILTDIHGKHQVMMGWEKEYMEFCVDKLQPHGRVLEVGFGLGYSAKHIQSFSDVTEHVIIECAPAVWDHMQPFLEAHDKATLVKGRWQDVLYTCGQFDCVFFDDYDTEHDMRRAETFRRELVEFDCLKLGSRIMFYSTSPGRKMCDSMDVESTPYTVDIPKQCNYARGNTMYALKETIVATPIKLPPYKPTPNFRILPPAKPLVGAKVSLNDAIYNMHCMYRDKNMEGLTKNTRYILNGGYTLEAKQKQEVEFYHAYSLFSSDPNESSGILTRLESEMDKSHDLYPFVVSNLERLTSNQQLQA